MAHHSTVKKAAEKGILLEDAPEGSDYRFRAFWPERAMELWGSNQSDLAANAIHARMMVLEHGVTVEQEDDQITVSFGENELHTFQADYYSPKDFGAEMAQALDQITDEMRAGDPEAEPEDDEDQRTGSVVPVKYKNAYKEAGHAGNCGDWLANLLIEHTTGQDGKLDVSAMDDIALANGVDTGKWNRTTNGWQGRLRMTARNAMVRKVAAKGFVLVPTLDKEVIAPEEWCRANAPKLKEAGTRKQKAA